MRAILQVKRKEWISPHYIRIILEGPELDRYVHARIGDNNKLIIPLDKTRPWALPVGPLQSGDRETSNFVVRTYTLRDLDPGKGEMTIDFVVHGDSGPASAWVMGAVPGDRLGVLMKEKPNRDPVNPSQYLFIGDHTALPVIGARLQYLPADAVGLAVIEIYGQEDVIPLSKPEGVAVEWIFNPHPGVGSALSSRLGSLLRDFPGDGFVFAAAEYKVAKEVQDILRDVLPRERWQAFSYWKFGESEDD